MRPFSKTRDREGRGPNLGLFLGKIVELFLALTQMPLILLCARQDRGVLANAKEQGPLLFPALVSGKAQGKDFTAVSLFPPSLSSCQNSGKQRRQCEHFPFLCKHVLFMGCRCQRSSWSSHCHASPAASGCGIVLDVPPLLQGPQLGHVAPGYF